MFRKKVPLTDLNNALCPQQSGQANRQARVAPIELAFTRLVTELAAHQSSVDVMDRAPPMITPGPSYEAIRALEELAFPFHHGSLRKRSDRLVARAAVRDRPWTAFGTAALTRRSCIASGRFGIKAGRVP